MSSTISSRKPLVPDCPQLPPSMIPVLPMPPVIEELPVESYPLFDGGFYGTGCVPTVELDPETGKIVIRVGSSYPTLAL